MSDDALRRLARAAGLYVEWTDANGRPHEVAPHTMSAVLEAIGYPSADPKQIADSQHRLERELRELPPLITAHERDSVRIGHSKHARLRTAGGEWQDLEVVPLSVGGSCIRVPEAIGYHELELEGSRHTLAVAPPRCYGIADAAPGRKLAGLSVQIYSLRGGHSHGFGDFAALSAFATQAGALGIDALAVSPTHARFAARPESISPYAPSSRFFLDPVYADIELAGLQPEPGEVSGELIDWNEAQQAKYALLRSAYEIFKQTGRDRESFRIFCERGGRRLRDHAVFEALAVHFGSQGKSSPSEWPEPYHDPQSNDVRAFAERQGEEVEYHLFLQWLTAESAAAAQRRARESMAVGLIADMAVGVDRAGSHAWSAPDELLPGLSIGAPPDIFQPAGQDWGLTTFSPTGLRKSGYDGFIAMVRASMLHAGGIRVDHAMGLRRLWLVPQGAEPTEGVYLSYPLQDLLRLIALESVLHRAILIGEDLGTVPDGFRAQLATSGILGMRVLWFEREDGGRFIPPERWEPQAAALTTTHDLPTVPGWWRERDIDWSAKLKRKTRLGSIGAERRDREKDRAQLWSAFQGAGCAKGAEPGQDEPDPVIEAALAYVGKSPCLLAMAAAEDVAGTSEQPNLPGTIEEHPNWRRRLPGDLLQTPAGRARLARLVGARKK